MAAAFDSETGAPREAAIAVRGLDVARPGEREPVFAGIDLDVAAGECVLLEGPTGSGKSTLLRTIAGLGGVERRAGTIETSGRPALLLQHVETQLLCPTIGEEVGMGLARAGLNETRKNARIRAALADVDLLDAERSEVDHLSAGQKQRVVLAALLALSPRCLLLDEPFASLDASSRRHLVPVIARLKRNGTALLIAEHAPRELLHVVDRRLSIESDGLRARPGRAANGPCGEPESAVAQDPPTHLDALAPRDRVLITGPNGSGKSFRLRQLALERSARGAVALVIQEPRRGLFARTVRDEIAFSIDRLGAGRTSGERRAARIDTLLERFELRPLAERSPRRLSFGQQHRLAIAAAIAAAPAFVLLDEPFAGLDSEARRGLLLALEKDQAESDATYLVASHDRDPLERWCTRTTAFGARGR